MSGLLAGISAAAFLFALEAATTFRVNHPTIIWLLPVAGMAVGWTYLTIGGRSGEGTGLLLDQIHEPTAWVPRRMAPLVATAAVVSHLFGASVGREGTGLQMSGSLADWLGRTLRLGRGERRVLLAASLAGGFGAMFGVPMAGTLFAIEVLVVRPTQGETLRRAGASVGWRNRLAGHHPLARWRALSHLLIPAAFSAVAGNLVVEALLPQAHEQFAPLHPRLAPATLVGLALLGALMGGVAIAFVIATETVQQRLERAVQWAPARSFMGGVVILAGVAMVGRDYLGLSLPLMQQALEGGDISIWAPVLKIAFTSVSLGSGFIGGEVTPLYVIGAAAGGTVGSFLGMDPVLGAAVGYVAVFGAAAKTPLACTVMAVESFGPGAAVPAAIGCFVAYACSGRRGLYPSQRVISGGSVVKRS